MGVQTSPAPSGPAAGPARERTPAGLTIQSVLRGSLAEQAGMAADDEWLAVGFGGTDGSSQPPETWRIHKLDDVPPLLGTRSQLTAWVSRDRRVLALPLMWPGETGTSGSQQTTKLSWPASATNARARPPPPRPHGPLPWPDPRPPPG